MPSPEIRLINQTETQVPSQVFLGGWFTDRCIRGDEPNYGYPKNHMPETTQTSMSVQTVFMASRKSK